MESQDKLLAKETFASLRKQVIGKGKLINLLSDEGFKRVFGTESNKDIAYSGACPFNLEPLFFEFQIETSSL